MKNIYSTTVKSLFSVLFILGLVSAGIAQQVSIAPSILRFNLDKGGNDSRVVTITNRSTIRQSMQTSIGDWYRDSLGNHVYLKPGEMKDRSNAAYVSITPSFIEIEPNETAEVLVSIQIPAADTVPTQMTWSMLFVQGTVEKTNPFVPENQLATQIRESYRFGVHIYNTPSVTNEAKAVLEDFMVVPATENDTIAKYMLRSKNDGDVILKCKTYLEITNLGNGETINTDPDEFTVFPNETKTSIFTLPDNLGAGEFSILGILDYGDQYPLEAIEKTIKIP
jgi:hypothetical protein